MKILLTTLLLVSASFVHAQKFRVFNTAREGNGFLMLATNQEWYPVSVRLEFDNTGLRFSEGSQTVFVVPARTDSFRIGELLREEGARRIGLNYKYVIAMGDVWLKALDRSYVYDLPFPKGSEFMLYQGYNSSFSHSGENALDFTMPEGTPILAVREGIVVKLEQSNNRSCTNPECKQYNNYIMVMHPDGSFAYYGHIRQNGAAMKIGDTVKKSELIAYSGNVGWSNGPHLHLAIFTGGFDKWTTMQTPFRTGRGGGAVLLREGTSYARNY